MYLHNLKQTFKVKYVRLYHRSSVCSLFLSESIHTLELLELLWSELFTCLVYSWLVLIRCSILWYLLQYPRLGLYVKLLDRKPSCQRDMKKHLWMVYIHSPKRHKLVATCQFYGLVVTCQQVTTNLSISSSYNKSVKDQACCNLSFADLLQLFETNCTKPVEIINLQQVCWQLATSLLTICNRLVVNKLSQAMWTHPDIGILITSCCKMSADLLQIARFWLCTLAFYPVTFSFWWMWTSESFRNVQATNRTLRTFVICLLVHICQKERIAFKIAATFTRQCKLALVKIFNKIITENGLSSSWHSLLRWYH